MKNNLFIQHLRKVLFSSFLFVIFFAISFKAEAQILTEVLTSSGDRYLSGPMTTGSDGNIWFFYNYDSNNYGLGHLTPRGVFTSISHGIPSENQILDMTSGPDGNFWYSKRGFIGRITPTGVATEFTSDFLSTNDIQIRSIVSGSDGNLWFNCAGLAIGKITPTGLITEFPVPSEWRDAITDLTLGPDRNIWFTSAWGQIGRITPTGVFTIFSEGIRAGSFIYGITAGPDGNLWFTELQDRIGRITPEGVVTEFSVGITPGSEPSDIITGSDGNLWFTEYGGYRIGRITPAGVVREFFQGRIMGSRPHNLISGPDGNPWFMNSTIYRVALLDDRSLSINPNISTTAPLNYPIPPPYYRPEKFPGTDDNPPDPISPKVSPEKLVDPTVFKQAPNFDQKVEQKEAAPEQESLVDKVLNFFK